MSSVRSELVQGYLGPRCVAWRSGAQAWQWRAADDVESGVRALAQGLQTEAPAPRARAALWLGGSLARPFIVQPVPGLKNWSEARRLAQALAPDETGLAGPCEVWLDAAAPGEAALGVAIDDATREMVERGFGEAGLSVVSMRPWWSVALDRALDETPGLARLVVAEPESLVVLAGRDGRFNAAVTCAPLPAPERAAAWLQRTVLGLAIAEGDGLRASLVMQADASVPALEAWT